MIETASNAGVELVRRVDTLEEAGPAHLSRGVVS